MHAALALEVGSTVELRPWCGWGLAPAEKEHIISEASQKFCLPDHAGLWRTTVIRSEGGQLFAIAGRLGEVRPATLPAVLAWHVHASGLEPSACLLCDVCFACPLCDEHVTVWALLATAQTCWSRSIARDVHGTTTVISGMVMHACLAPHLGSWRQLVAGVWYRMVTQRESRSVAAQASANQCQYHAF